MMAQYIYEKIKKRVPMEGDLKGSEYTIMGSESRNLLIVACSKRKRLDSSLLPAIERYDGSTFRTIRRFLRLKPSEVPDIYSGSRITKVHHKSLAMLDLVLLLYFIYLRNAIYFVS